MSELCPHCGARLPEVADPFCPECRRPLDEPPAGRHGITPAGTFPRPPASPRPRADDALWDRVDDLEQRVDELERRLRRSSLFGESFLGRAFTVWGHWFVAYLILALPLILFAMCAGGLGRR